MTHSGTSYEGIRLSHAAQVVQGLEVLFGAIHLASERCLLGLSTLFALIFSKTHFLSLRIHTATHNHDYTHRIRDCFIFLDQRQVYCWTSIDKLSLDTIYSRYNKYLLYFFFVRGLQFRVQSIQIRVKSVLGLTTHQRMISKIDIFFHRKRERECV